jgi:Tfp pilus assembly protein PilO
MSAVLFVLAVAAIALVTYWGLKWWRKLEEAERRKLIEKQMRQQIVDAESERIAAQKILRENGQL